MKKIVLIFLVIIVGLSSFRPAFAQLFSLSTSEEIEIGNRIARQIERQLPIYNDAVMQARLDRIGRNLVFVCDRRNIPYTFKIIDKDKLNAFAIFGGHIYVYRGVFERIESDDELAAVLAHEIGHVSARHLAKRVEQTRTVSFGLSLLDAFVLRKQKERQNIYRIINIGYDIIQRGYSRQDELGADRLGTRYMYRAGYDPHAAITMLNRLKKEEQQTGFDPFANIGILRTHPYIDERINTILQEIANIKLRQPP